MADHVSHEHHEMSQREKDKIAKEKFGKKFDDLATDEKKAVGGAYR